MRGLAKTAAFTLVELLVVIAIIGILVALLLPAVQSARESGRRAQCSNNVKQISLALRTYAVKFRVFPPGAVVNAKYPGAAAYNVRDEAISGQHGTSWMLQIMPQMEQLPLFEQWDFTQNVVGNKELALIDIPAFYCPSRRRSVRPEDRLGTLPDFNSGGNDYAGCLGRANAYWNCKPSTGCSDCNHFFAGGRQIMGPGYRHVGVFAPNSATSLAGVHDGTSQTILIGEAERNAPPAGFSPSFLNCSMLCYDGWAQGRAGTMFSTNTAGNSDNGQPGGINTGFFESAGSDHVGGAYFGLVDGSVKFYSEHLDSRIYAELGSRAGNEDTDLP